MKTEIHDMERTWRELHKIATRLGIFWLKGSIPIGNERAEAEDSHLLFILMQQSCLQFLSYCKGMLFSASPYLYRSVDTVRVM